MLAVAKWEWTATEFTHLPRWVLVPEKRLGSDLNAWVCAEEKMSPEKNLCGRGFCANANANRFKILEQSGFFIVRHCSIEMAPGPDAFTTKGDRNDSS